jgi:hypothetical protein
MKRSVLVTSGIAASILALGALWWLRAPDQTAVVHGSSFSTFSVPEHLDDSGFVARLHSTGFVAVTDADFGSLLPPKFKPGSAPGHATADFTAMPAYRHTTNSDSHTRIVGYDMRNRRVHYYYAQLLSRNGAGDALKGDERDMIEKELRK